MLSRICRTLRRLVSHLLHLRFSSFFRELRALFRRACDALCALRQARRLRSALSGRAAWLRHNRQRSPARRYTHRSRGRAAGS